MNREDFEMLNSGIVYFDNSATTLKPKQVVNSIVDYYTKYTANCHRGDYKNSIIVDNKYEETRTNVKELINASSEKEIIFTSGSTDSLNKIVFGFMKYNLKPGDEVLLTKAEHASNFLPWIKLQEEIGIVIKYIPLENNQVTVSSVLKMINNKTKVISIAHVTNVLGDKRPIEEIGKICKNNNIYFVVDAAQSIPHTKVDVNKYNIDFLSFSAHKMLGPTGIGCLYGKIDLLEKMEPLTYGGGMNNSYDTDGNYELKDIPTRFEAGTPNIAGVIGLNSAIDYINNIGYENIEKHVKDIRNYLLEEMEKIPNVVIYNKDIDGATIVFNLEDVFPQDTAIYLDHYNINVRAGNHCAKVLKEEISAKNTCRISLYLYNTKEECDKLIEVLKDSKNIFKVIL